MNLYFDFFYENLKRVPMEEPDKTARKFVLNQVMNRKQDKSETKISEPKTMKLKPVRQVKPIQLKLQPKKLIQKNEVKTKEELVESAETQKKLLDKARDELKKKKGTETVDSFQLPNPINEIETAVSGEIYLPPKFLLNRHYMASYAKYDNVGSIRRTTAAIDSYIKRKKI